MSSRDRHTAPRKRKIRGEASVCLMKQIPGIAAAVSMKKSKI